MALVNVAPWSSGSRSPHSDELASGGGALEISGSDLPLRQTLWSGRSDSRAGYQSYSPTSPRLRPLCFSDPLEVRQCLRGSCRREVDPAPNWAFYF